MTPKLVIASKGDFDIKHLMEIHYSHPNGFVGRQIMYKVLDENNKFCGAIAGGSATVHLPGREEFFGDEFELQQIVNNTFYHLLDVEDINFGTKVLKLWRRKIVEDWQKLYEDRVIGFETLVELPRTGSIYKADNWTLTGTTKGYTCRRVGGNSDSEKFGGVRVWDYDNLKPKLVFCKLNTYRPEVVISHKKLF